MLLQQKSILARLLARENLTVKHTKANTATFDCVGRILSLPIWKDMSPALYDLFVGHEVGHALYTPRISLGEEARKHRVPAVYINIVEDIRIEVEILSRFPGLVKSFKEGYKELDETYAFFGSSDPNTYGFADRLNIFAKTRGTKIINFSPEEQVIVDAAFKAKTWEAVIKVAKMIQDHVGGGLPVFVKGTDGSSNNPVSKGREKQSPFSERKAKLAKKGDMAGKDGCVSDDVVTMGLEDRIKQNLVDQNVNLAYAPSTQDLVKIMKDSRFTFNHGTFNKNEQDFIKMMARRFKMVQSARISEKTKTTKTGSIDPLRLASYKFQDDIFASREDHFNSKNHAIIMLVDLSGSMSSVISNVFRTVGVFAEFCRQSGIECRVFGFTTKFGRTIDLENRDYGGIDLTEIISSNTKENIEAIIGGAKGSLGGTPLIPSIICMHPVVDQMMAKKNIEKMSLIVISDGEGSSFFGHNPTLFFGRQSLSSKTQIKSYKSELKMVLESFRMRDISTIQYFIKTTCHSLEVLTGENAMGFDKRIILPPDSLSNRLASKTITNEIMDTIK